MPKGYPGSKTAGHHMMMRDCLTCGDRYFQRPDGPIVQCPRCEAVANKTANRILPAEQPRDDERQTKNAAAESKRRYPTHFKR